MKKSNLIINTSEENGFLLNLKELVSAPKNIKKIAKEKELIKKTEQHITIIESKTIDILLEKLKAFPAEEKDFSRLEELAKKIEWSYIAKPKFFYITKEYDYPNPKKPKEVLKEKRESIIQMIDLVGLKELYNELSKILSEKLNLPFPHITLYTNSTRDEKKTRGIGIYSYSDFKQLKPEIK